MRVSSVILRSICLAMIVGLAPSLSVAEQKKGLGGIFRASTKAPATVEQGPVGKACGVRGKALGKVVEKGPGKWKLYDTAPGSTKTRAFYLTGFADGCPRRFNGAVAMFGSVDLYELVHYGPVGVKPSGSATDQAYARLRARSCGSGACSERSVKRLQRSVAFVNVYPTASNPKRLELLLNKGKLAAVSTK